MRTRPAAGKSWVRISPLARVLLRITKHKRHGARHEHRARAHRPADHRPGARRRSRGAGSVAAEAMAMNRPAGGWAFLNSRVRESAAWMGKKRSPGVRARAGARAEK